MQVTITGKHRPLSDSLKIYIEEKVSELTHFYDKIIDANVVLEKEGKNQVAAIQLRVSGHTFNTENKSTNLRAAIDSSVEKLEKQLVKYKQKLQRRGPKSQEGQLFAIEASAEAGELEPVEEQGAVLIFEEEDEAEEPQKTGS
ncbi:ribosome hibernation-promoting factor, HPF/YfiA family [Gemmatimonadota bacterium]